MSSEFSLHERAAEAALKAGEAVLLKAFKPDHIAKTSYKAHKEFVTAADLASNKAIQDVLRKMTPDVKIVSEEGAVGSSRVTQEHLQWILDPLDGTTNFSIGLPLWGISLALAYDGVPIRGWLSLPILNERYVAKLHEGAWKNGKKFRMKDVKSIRDSVGLLCHGYSEEERAAGIKTAASLTGATLSTRRLGAACVELAWVATGRASYLVIYGAKPWDLAAGTLLVTEAGGLVGTPDGCAWTLEEPDCVAGSPNAHQEVMEVLLKG